MLSSEHGDIYKLMCIECWRHIHEFHNFQVAIIQVQSKLKGVEHTLFEKINVPAETNTPRVVDDNNMCDDDIIIEEECMDVTSPPYLEVIDEISSSYETVEDEINPASTVEVEVDVTTTCIPSPPEVEVDVVTLRREEPQIPQNPDVQYNQNTIDELIRAAADCEESESSMEPSRKKKKSNQCTTFSGGENSRDYDSQSETSSSKGKSTDEKNRESDAIIAKWLPQLQCTHCQKHFPAFTLLKKHHRQTHPKEKFFVICCDRNMLYRCTVEEHVRLHLDPNAFRCKVCNRRFSSRANLCTHKQSQCVPSYESNNLSSASTKTKAESDELISRWRPDLQCELCSEHFPSFTLLKKHARRQHPNNEFYISCCERKLKFRCQIEDHASIHIDSSSFKCNLCGKCFLNGNNLQRHKRDSHSYIHDDIIPQENNLPDATLTQTRNARKSFKELDEVIAKWRPQLKCLVCEEICVSFTHLSDHYSLKHLDKELYIECCGRKLSSRALAARHAKRHLYPDMFTCEVCGRSYTRDFKLRDHMRLEHPNFETVFFDEDDGLSAIGNKNKV